MSDSEYWQKRDLSLLFALFLFTAFPIFLVAVNPTFLRFAFGR
ncbi:hypothetical protein M947_03765 [Sulfurimonas hongkongensis]|uniref:Uncharacterized protein n=1 Tax=Sulfurimonas hongkongensis TaxID=1172190 RepID=T0JPW9_9BACT|nr:hypothetical protein M947_03765 [Sulfurimonas hongkongensis]